MLATLFSLPLPTFHSSLQKPSLSLFITTIINIVFEGDASLNEWPLDHRARWYCLVMEFRGGDEFVDLENDYTEIYTCSVTKLLVSGLSWLLNLPWRTVKRTYFVIISDNLQGRKLVNVSSRPTIVQIYISSYILSSYISLLSYIVYLILIFSLITLLLWRCL